MIEVRCPTSVVVPHWDSPIGDGHAAVDVLLDGNVCLVVASDSKLVQYEYQHPIKYKFIWVVDAQGRTWGIHYSLDNERYLFKVVVDS